jgi:hypothetical protein
MMDINKWTAKQCGLSNENGEYWDITDARCRELFWDWWIKQCRGRKRTSRTELFSFETRASSPEYKVGACSYDLTGYSHASLGASEVECIEAIMKADD